MKLRSLLMAAVLCALCAVEASALEYTVAAPDDYLFGRPTSMDVIYTEEESPNTDRSKNVALIPPGFGTPTSYLPGSGEYMTPNLVPGALSGGLVNQVGSVNAPVSTGQYPPVDASSTFTVTQIPGVASTSPANTVAFTNVTGDLYYADGSLGTLKIPSIGLTVNIFEGTDNAALAKGAGHFANTSIWAGNVCLAGHNRGVTNHFGKIHTLNVGDTITLTTKFGTRTYAVASVEKVGVMDSSGTAATSGNRVTLYTCVMNEPDYRWCVIATAV